MAADTGRDEQWDAGRDPASQIWDNIFQSLHLASYTCIPTFVAAALSANSLSEFPPVKSKMRNLSLSSSLFNQPASAAEVKWG